MPKATEISSTTALLCFAQSTRLIPMYYKILPHLFYRDLRCYARINKTSVDACLASVLQAIPTLLHHSSQIVVDSPHWNIKPNMFSFLVGISGSNKSQPHRTLFTEPLTEIQDMYGVNLILREVTFPGILKFFKKNDMRGAICGDELAPILESIYSPKGYDEHKQGFRPMINSLYSGDAYTKHLASKTFVLNDPLLNIAGVCQPLPFLSFLKKIVKFEDGSVDRFVAFVADVDEPTDEPSDLQDDISKTCKDNPGVAVEFVGKVKKMYKMLYDIANVESKGRKFVLTKEAKNKVTSYRESESQSAKVAVHVALDCLDEMAAGNSESIDQLRSPQPTKLTDYVVKFAFLINIVEKMYGASSRNEMVSNEELMTITEKHIILSIQMVDQLDELRKVYIDCARNNLDGVDQVTRMQTSVSTKSNICKMILLMPGKCITPNLFARSNRGWCNNNSVNSSKIESAMLALTDGKSRGQEGFVGVMKSKVFYKANPEDVDANFMMNMFSISQQQYHESFMGKCKPVAGVIKKKEDFESYMNGLEMISPFLSNSNTSSATQPPRPEKDVNVPKRASSYDNISD